MATRATFPFPHMFLMVMGAMMLPHLTKAQNISLGSSLTAGERASSWVSPSGDFAFGFLPVQPQSNQFILGIWFDKIADKTVVWFAKPNPNALIGIGSKVEVTPGGQLLLRDHNDTEVWRPETDNSNMSTTHAAMLDNGNFVLASEGSNNFQWQSFENPSDTVLPMQQLSKVSNLIARLTETDYSDGRFKLAMQQDGNLVLYPIAVPTSTQYDAYWSSDTVGKASFLHFGKSGGVDLALGDGKSQENIMSGPVLKYGTYQRARLDPDGVFRLYTFSFDESNRESWRIEGQVPSDICRALTSDAGSGACGYNAYCTIEDNMPKCSCPPRYTFMDPSRKDKGCRPEFPTQNCEVNGSSLGSQYEMIPFMSADWPRADYEHLTGLAENNCTDECLKDCFCAVAIYRNGDCWKKKLPLTNGRKVDQGKALLKVLRENTSTTNTMPPPADQVFKEKNNKVLVLTGSLLLGGSVLVNFLVAGLFLICCSRRRMVKNQNHQQQDLSMLGTSLRSFTYSELEKATQGFKEELGRGAFGIVYKGIFLWDTSIQVAVKKLINIEEAEKEFMNEVKVIAQTHHKNLVRLLGYCNEGENRLLVYEFMSNGSLTNFLFENSRPNWNRRTEIAYGITKGVRYLHEECEKQIIHCDIKPHNVLLDDCFTPKVSDFGLAKLMRTDQTKTNTGIRGTKGYVAPEWFKTTAISTKVDVYSFGVMLLEIICCRKNVEKSHGEGQEAILTDWACDCYRMGRLDELMKHDTEAIADIRRLERFVKVALWCIQEEPTLRPSMKKVAQMLEGGVEVPVPPDPSSFISSIH